MTTYTPVLIVVIPAPKSIAPVDNCTCAPMPPVDVKFNNPPAAESIVLLVVFAVPIILKLPAAEIKSMVLVPPETRIFPPEPFKVSANAPILKVPVFNNCNAFPVVAEIVTFAPIVMPAFELLLMRYAKQLVAPEVFNADPEIVCIVADVPLKITDLELWVNVPELAKLPAT